MLTPRPRPRRSALAALALVAAGLATTHSPATAVSADLAYDCSSPDLGDFGATAVVDTDAPAELGTGISASITTSTTVVIPDEVVDQLRALSITTVDGTAAATGTVDGAPRQVSLTIPSTAVPSDGPMTLVGSGPAGEITGGAVGTTILLGAGDFDVTIRVYDNAAVLVGSHVVDCDLQPAQPTLVDSVAVVPAPTTTTVTVQGAPIEYGDSPSVTAAVSVPGSNAKPAGKVAFTFEGKTVTVDVKGGKTKPTSLAPALHKGANSVSAVFTPTDPNLAGSQTVKAFTVVKAASTTSVSAVYRPAKDKVVARGKVSSAHGTPVAGQVKYVLKRNGVKIRTKTVELNRFDVAKARFRNIAKRGKYAVIARYLGSSTLKRSNDKVAFQI